MALRPLRKILSLQSALVAVPPFIVMAILAGTWLFPQIRSEIESRQIQLATTIASQTEAYLTASETILKGIAALSGEGLAVAHNQQILDANLKPSPSLKSLYIVGSDGRIEAMALPGKNRAQRQDLMGLDLSHNSLFRDVRRRQGPVWSDTFLSVVGGGISVALGVPMEQMVIIGEIDLSLLTKYLQHISTVKDQLIFVVDRRGQVIADQDGLYTAQQLNLSNISIVKQGLKASPPSAGRFVFNGRPVIGSMVKAAFIDWHVLVIMPEEAAYRPMWTFFRIFASALCLTLLVGIVAAMLMARRLAFRFEGLAAHARRVAAGEEAPEWPRANITEVNELATDLQQMADAIREREAYNRILFADSPIPLAVIDPSDARFIDCNAAAIRIYGVASRQALVGKTFSEFSTPAQYDGGPSQAAIRMQIRTCLEAGVSAFEWRLLRASGETWHGEVNASLIHHGEQPFMQLSLQDVTQRKQIEAARKKLEEQLQQSQKIQAIGTLAGGIAHDFNNILFPVLGYTELVLGQIPESSPLRTLLNEVLAGTLRARDLVKQILAFSRQAQHEKKPVVVQSILKEVLKLSRSTLPATIDIKKEISEDCGMVMADAIQVHQIAMNIITNAFHAMEDTGGVLTVGLEEVTITSGNLPDPELSPGPYVRLSIADTGIGMDKLVASRIFEPYFTTKDMNKGTGLGLSVVNGIVKSHGGGIQVLSRPGKGSTFHVYLPRMPSKAAAMAEIKPVATPTGSERILLVDDDMAISRLVKQMLESLGYQVHALNDSTDALGLFRDTPAQFDLVITDMTMPQMTGDRLSFELKNIRPDIPIILCTGFSEKVTAGNVKAINVDKILMKPIVRNELANAVRELLEITH